MCVLLALGTFLLATTAKIGRFGPAGDPPTTSVVKMKLATAGKQSLAVVEDQFVETPFLVPAAVGPSAPPSTHCGRRRPVDPVPSSDQSFPPRLWQRPPPSA